MFLVFVSAGFCAVAAERKNFSPNTGGVTEADGSRNSDGDSSPTRRLHLLYVTSREESKEMLAVLTDFRLET